MSGALLFRAAQKGSLTRPQGAGRLRRTLAVRRREARDRERSQRPFSAALLVAVHRRARADKMTISIGFVDAAHAGPEFIVAYPGRGKGSLFTAVGSVPFVRRHDLCRVRRIL